MKFTAILKNADGIIEKVFFEQDHPISKDEYLFYEGSIYRVRAVAHGAETKIYGAE